MPKYDFYCKGCDFADEIELSIHHDHKLSCPSCQLPLHKVIAPAPIHFRGGGYYSTDK